MYTAIIAGSTGLIGSHLLTCLLENDHIVQVTVLLRKDTDMLHPKLKKLVVDFDKLGTYHNELKADIVYSCLGTTRRKTPDKRQYFKIEHDYPVELARMAMQNGATQFHYISSMGAHPERGNFYTKNKGMAEESLSATGIQSIYFYRPSLLLGERKEGRILEKVSEFFLTIFKPLMTGSLKKYRAIQATDVAKAMLYNSLNPSPGLHTYLSDAIQEQADRK